MVTKQKEFSFFSGLKELTTVNIKIKFHLKIVKKKFKMHCKFSSFETVDVNTYYFCSFIRLAISKTSTRSLFITKCILGIKANPGHDILVVKQTKSHHVSGSVRVHNVFLPVTILFILPRH